MMEKYNQDLAKTLAKHSQGMQSRADIINQGVAEVLSRAEKEGLKLTDADVTALRTQVISEELKKPEQPEPTEPQAGAPTEGLDSEDAVNRAADALMKQYGIQLEDTDEEVQPIIKAVADGVGAKAYLAAIEEALQKKKARIEKEGAAAPVSPGFVPGATGSPLYNQLIPPDQLWEMMKRQGGF